jgi:hypothetical protein
MTPPGQTYVPSRPRPTSSGYFTAAAFLDPVLDDHAAQHWDPDRADWAP